MMVLRFRTLALGVLLFACSAPAIGAEPTHFEHRVAPILERQCLTCHNSDKRKGGLVLETRASMLAGGDDGLVLRPGDPAGSRLLKMVSGPDAKMPKKGDPLTPEQVEALRRWIAEGAPWPEGTKLREKPRADGTWWSLQPIQRPEVPTIAGELTNRVRNPIDAFVFARLTEKGLSPAHEADRRTLVRRLYFDLIGLPPMPKQIDAFVADARPDAYERLVDELLSSPHYGERWARHWMDIVHYADTHGFERDRPRPHAWPYRDYLIRSFNENKRYNRFLLEQIAGDAVDPKNPDAIIATGYLAAGPFDLVSRVETKNRQLNREARVEELDDIVTTVMTSTMAMTVNCARCHDHKFDPIPQEDYYRLTAVFAGTNRWDNGGRTERTVDAPGARELVAKREKLEAALRETRSQLAAMGATGLDLADVVGGGDGFGTGKVGAGIDPRSGKSVGGGAQMLGGVKTNTYVTAEHPFVDGLAIPDGGAGGKATTPISSTGLGVQLPDTSGQVWDHVRHGKMTGQVNTVVGGIDYAAPGHSMLGLHANKVITFDLDAIREATDYGQMRLAATVGFGGSDGPYTAAFRVFVDGKRVAGKDALRRTGAPVVLDVPLDADARFLTLVGTDDTGDISHTQVFFGDPRLVPVRDEKSIDPEKRRRIVKLTDERDRLARELAALPVPRNGRVYTVSLSKPEPTHVLERGLAGSPMNRVTPGSLGAIAGLPSDFGDEAMSDKARRRALAEWITDERNPLTRRVIVNRLWQWHFGRGIVDTPSDFGANGSKPTHPLLLDWLASEFAERGGSIKAMHRLIVTSATYRQSASVNDRAMAIDADNRLLWRANLRRLDAEQVRDAILAVAGTLNRQVYGEPFRDFRYVDKYAPEYHHLPQDRPELWRRSVYRFTVRSVPHVFMKVLDAPDPSILTAKRQRTTTALQSLALLNNVFVVDQAGRFAKRVEGEVGDDTGKKVERAYRLALGRSPNADEASAAGALIDRAGLSELCRVLFNCSEFLYAE